MRDPILMKFGTEQHIWNSMNMKRFKIQDGGRPPYWKTLEMLWTSLFTTSGSKKLKIQNKQFKQTNKHNVQYTNKDNNK